MICVEWLASDEGLDEEYCKIEAAIIVAQCWQECVSLLLEVGLKLYSSFNFDCDTLELSIINNNKTFAPVVCVYILYIYIYFG